MARELPRVIQSLAPGRQSDIAGSDYELIVVDNGSPTPPSVDDLRKLAPNVELICLPPGSPSPAHALNVGVARARGTLLGVMVDGSHIATPGVLALATKALSTYERGVALAPTFALGWDALQTAALEAGYDTDQEDALLAQLDWLADAYLLFDVGAPVGGNPDAWFGSIAESNLYFMARTMWDEIGGADERFDLPGGGYLNPDVMKRALDLPGALCIELLGEATFHQLHGDPDRRSATTRAALAQQWRSQYEAIRGVELVANAPDGRLYVGGLSAPAQRHFQRSVAQPFDEGSWAARRPVPRLAGRAADPTARPVDAPLLSLAKREFAAGRFAAAAVVCRFARAQVADFSEFVPILIACSPWLRFRAIPTTQQYEVHVARGEALTITADSEAAIAEFELALECGAPDARAHLGLAMAKMPGDSYLTHIAALHQLLRPRTYLEIGVASGLSIVLAKPPTLSIGIDPTPAMQRPASTDTWLYPTTSDEFFASKADEALRGRPIDLAFVDGLHHFEQALRDFAYVERHSSSRTVLLFHDTLPLDERTQRRERETDYWTGDIWKVAVFLAERRPDLTLFTLPTYPAGLTVVTHLDSARQPSEYMADEAIDDYLQLDFDAAEERRRQGLNLVPNDWSLVAQRLDPLSEPQPASA